MALGVGGGLWAGLDGSGRYGEDEGAGGPSGVERGKAHERGRLGESSAGMLDGR